MAAEQTAGLASGTDEEPACSVQPVVLLTGASSQLGVFLIPRLIESGYRVVAVSRRASQPKNFESNPLWIQPGILAGEDPALTFSSTVPPPRMMISCGPLELAVSAISQWDEIHRLVMFSTTSVFTKATSANLQEREQIAEILKFENILKVLCKKRSTELVILRPTLIYGCGLDQNISRLARWIKRFGWLPVAGAANGLRQPVHADDLAELAVSALQFDTELQLDSPACGGSTLSYREMVERIFDSQSRSRRVISLSPGLLSFGIKLASALRLSGQTNQEMVARQSMDQVFDDSVLKEQLNYNPRPFNPTPEDFKIPTEAAKYQLR